MAAKRVGAEEAQRLVVTRPLAALEDAAPSSVPRPLGVVADAKQEIARRLPTIPIGAAKFARVALILACVAWLGGCGGSLSSNIQQNSFATTPAAQSAAKLTAGATPGNSAYKIGPLDVLSVQVFKVPDLTKDVQVADDGTITYPLAGDVWLPGKPPGNSSATLSKNSASNTCAIRKSRSSSRNTTASASPSRAA